jgi:S1-C subfamily serine protease
MLVVLQRRQRTLLLGGCAAFFGLVVLFSGLLWWQSGWIRRSSRKDTDERSAQGEKGKKEGERESLRPEEVYRRALQSAAFITVHMRSVPVPGGISNEYSTGSAVLVDGDRRLLVTAYHVVEDRVAVRVQFPLYDGERLVVETARYPLNAGIPGQVVARDPQRDLAVIQVERLPGNVRPMPLAAASPNPGAAVQAVGNPGASAARWVHSQGAVRQVVHKRVQASNPGGKISVYECWMVETQTPINQGDSGGPLISDRCELVGINSTGGGKGSLMNNCIDIREVRTVLARVAP